MRHQAMLLWLVIIGADLQRGSSPSLFCMLSHVNGFTGGVRPGASNDWHAPRRSLNDDLDDVVVLGVREGRGFTRGATGNQTIGLLLLDTVVHQPPRPVSVDAVVSFEGGNERDVKPAPLSRANRSPLKNPGTPPRQTRYCVPQSAPPNWWGN